MRVAGWGVGGVVGVSEGSSANNTLGFYCGGEQGRGKAGTAWPDLELSWMLSWLERLCVRAHVRMCMPYTYTHTCTNIPPTPKQRQYTLQAGHYREILYNSVLMKSSFLIRATDILLKFQYNPSAA